MIIRLRFIISACVFLLALATTASASQLPLVVLLHGEKTPSTWTETVRTGLADSLAGVAEVRETFLGGRALNEESAERIAGSLAETYADVAPLAVVTAGELPFAFMRKYRDRLFKTAPIVYCDMLPPSPDMLRQSGDSTGIPLDLAIDGTVDLIFSMRPATKLVVAITDDTETGRALLAQTQRAMVPYEEQAELMIPGMEPGDDDGLTLSELGSVLSSIPGDGVVLFLGFRENRLGINVSDEQIVKLFETRIVSPVFVLDDRWLGTGVVGGVLVRGEELGKDVGELVLRIRDREPIREMLPMPTPAVPFFDATALARFNLPTPEGAQIINAPELPEKEEGADSAPILWLSGLVLAAILFLVIRRADYKP